MSAFRSNIYNSNLVYFLKHRLTMRVSLCCFWGKIYFSWMLLQLLGDKCLFSKWLVMPVWRYSLKPWDKGILNVSAQYSEVLFLISSCFCAQKTDLICSVGLLSASAVDKPHFHPPLALPHKPKMYELFCGFQHANKHWSNTVMGLSLLLIALQDLFLAKNVYSWLYWNN